MVKNKIEVKIDIHGLNELMKGPEIQAHLKTAGDAVARSAGTDYDSSVHVADFVAIANVYPNSKEAAKENYESNTLLKAISSVGLNTRKGGK